MAATSRAKALRGDDARQGLRALQEGDRRLLEMVKFDIAALEKAYRS